MPAAPTVRNGEAPAGSWHRGLAFRGPSANHPPPVKARPPPRRLTIHDLTVASFAGAPPSAAYSASRRAHPQQVLAEVVKDAACQPRLTLARPRRGRAAKCAVSTVETAVVLVAEWAVVRRTKFTARGVKSKIANRDHHGHDRSVSPPDGFRPLGRPDDRGRQALSKPFRPVNEGTRPGVATLTGFVSSRGRANNTSVASVTGTGLVLGQTAGSATITANQPKASAVSSLPAGSQFSRLSRVARPVLL